MKIASKFSFIAIYGLGGLLILTSFFWLTSCKNNADRLSTATTTPNSVPPPTAIIPAANLTAKIGKAERIVALTSLSADIIQRLSPNKLVGITGSKLLTQNPAFSKLPRVAEGRTPPNLEKIVALKPDLVIGAAGMHDQVLAQLKSSGIPAIDLSGENWNSTTF